MQFFTNPMGHGGFALLVLIMSVIASIVINDDIDFGNSRYNYRFTRDLFSFFIPLFVFVECALWFIYNMIIINTEAKEALAANISIDQTWRFQGVLGLAFVGLGMLFVRFGENNVGSFKRHAIVISRRMVIALVIIEAAGWCIYMIGSAIPK